jgi:hypothetical protein
MGISPVRRNTSTSVTVRPVFLSIETARSDRPSSVAVVSQMRSPRIAGDDQPTPAIGVFHAILSDSLHSNGSPLALEWPSPPGPRNWDQSSAPSARHAGKASASMRRPVVFPRFRTAESNAVTPPARPMIKNATLNCTGIRVRNTRAPAERRGRSSRSRST